MKKLLLILTVFISLKVSGQINAVNDTTRITASPTFSPQFVPNIFNSGGVNYRITYVYNPSTQKYDAVVYSKYLRRFYIAKADSSSNYISPWQFNHGNNTTTGTWSFNGPNTYFNGQLLANSYVLFSGGGNFDINKPIEISVGKALLFANVDVSTTSPTNNSNLTYRSGGGLTLKTENGGNTTSFYGDNIYDNSGFRYAKKTDITADSAHTTAISDSLRLNNPNLLKFNYIGGAESNPILLGNPSGWDANIKEWGNTIKIKTTGAPDTLVMVYSGFIPPDVGTNSYIGIAISTDNGKTFTKEGNTGDGEITTLASQDPYLIIIGDTFYMYVEDKSVVPYKNIRCYTSNIHDRKHWTDRGTVLDIGSSGAWDFGDVSSPTVWYENGVVNLFYEGRNTAIGNSGAIGLATSTDGLTFTKNGGNPLITGNTATTPTIAWGKNTVCDDIVKNDGKYYMSFHAFPKTSFVQGMAVSASLSSGWQDYLGSWISNQYGVDNQTAGLMLNYDGAKWVGIYANSDFTGLNKGYLLVQTSANFNQKQISTLDTVKAAVVSTTGNVNAAGINVSGGITSNTSYGNGSYSVNYAFNTNGIGVTITPSNLPLKHNSFGALFSAMNNTGGYYAWGRPSPDLVNSFRPEFGFFRGSSNYPEGVLREHPTSNLGLQLAVGNGSRNPRVGLSMEYGSTVTKFIIPDSTKLNIVLAPPTATTNAPLSWNSTTKDVELATVTGSGNVVLGTSPTFITNIKTPAIIATGFTSGTAGTDSLLVKNATTNVVGKIAAGYYAPTVSPTFTTVKPASTFQTPIGAITDSVVTKNAATLKLGAVPVSQFVTTSTGRIGTATLTAGTVAVSITGITTSSKAFCTRTVASGTTLTTGITAVCTAGTLTITADVAAGTINTADTSTYNYMVVN